MLLSRDTASHPRTGQLHPAHPSGEGLHRLRENGERENSSVRAAYPADTGRRSIRGIRAGAHPQQRAGHPDSGPVQGVRRTHPRASRGSGRRDGHDSAGPGSGQQTAFSDWNPGEDSGSCQEHGHTQSAEGAVPRDGRSGPFAGGLVSA